MSKKKKDDYDRLIKYCVDQGWTVEEPDTLEAEAEEDGLIKIGTLICQPLKTFSLLHEIGHLLVWADDYREKYPGYKKNNRHKHFQVAVVEEEIKSWDAGLAVANELGIKIDLKKWHAHKYDCVHAYVSACRRPNMFEKIEKPI